METTYEGPYPAPEGMAVPPKAFAAVGVAISSPGIASGGRGTPVGEAVLAAMTQAVKDAQAEGITDQAIIQERILIARDYATLSLTGEGTGLGIMAKAIANAQAAGVTDPNEIAGLILRALQMSQVAIEARDAAG